MNKKIALVLVVVILVGVAFYGGMKYGVSQNATLARGVGGQRFMRQGGSNTPGGGFVSGDILSKDDKSVIIKLRDGGSKLIFLTASASIMKAATGSLSDLVVGEQITATGNTNPDGSITAQSIQIRPSLPANR